MRAAICPFDSYLKTYEFRIASFARFSSSAETGSSVIALDLPLHQIENDEGGIGAGARVGHEDPGTRNIGPGGGSRRIRESTAGSDLVEQSRRKPSSEDLPEDVHRRVVGVVRLDPEVPSMIQAFVIPSFSA